MAATKSAKNPTDHNDTPNTPEVREDAIAKMKVDELRRKLHGHGVKGTAELKKPELVKKLIKAEIASTKNTKSAKSTKSTKSSDSTKSSSKAAPKRSAKNPTSHKDTPDVSESAIAAMKADEIRRKLRGHGVKGTAELKKPELVKKLISVEIDAAKAAKEKSTTTPAKASTAKAKAGTAKADTTTASKAKGTKGGIRTGKAASSSVKYSQVITSTEDKPERAGRSLVTTDHEVIRQWAKARKAVPSTVAGTEHDGHLGVLRFDFPGYSGDRLTAVEWDEWLATFDKRRLNFIYQQRQSNGKRSNFFRLENPDE